MVKGIVKTIIISRTDGIGDVVLSLPVAFALKKAIPLCRILFLASAYTKPIIEACENIDAFLDWTEIQRQSPKQQRATIRNYNADAVVHLFPRHEIARLMAHAKVPLRIGTMGRLYHWFSCNKLVFLRRKNSATHEALHNIRLVRCLGASAIPLDEIKLCYGLTKAPTLDAPFANIFPNNKITVVIHPRSKGSAREWGLDNFTKLIALLPSDRFSVVVSGSADERESLKDFLDQHAGRIIDLVGKCSLKQLIAVIHASNALVAVSTGPLHIAAALGIKTIGLYAPKKNISPYRWGPLGIRAGYLVLDKKCKKCSATTPCECIQAISSEQVAKALENIR